MAWWSLAAEPHAPAALQPVEPAGGVHHPDGWTALAWPATGAEPHALVALRLAHHFAPGEPYVREGWQSWSTPVHAHVGTGVRRGAAADPPRYGRRHWLAAPPYAGDESYGVWRSASLTAYVEPASAAVLVAVPDGLWVVREEPVSGRHPVVWFTTRAVSDDELAARLARPAPVAAAHLGWTTWEAYQNDLRGEDLHDDLRTIERRFGDTVDVVVADDGWQRAIGDWVPRDRAMGRALGEVADRGRLALWWAPFVVHREAALAAAHPDWLLRDRDRRPVVALARDDPWEAWALDLTNPDVLGWLAATARRLAADGARLLKCDFLYASAFTGDAAREGTCFDPSVTGEEVHRGALRAIGAAGIPLIGCGAPLWPSAGLVDLLRVGPDVGRCWWRPPPPELEPADAGGCLANAWVAARRRAWMDGALWRNDPDAVYASAGPAGDAWLAWVADQGLPMVLGDPLRTLGEPALERWRRAVDRWRETRDGSGHL